MTRRKRKPNSGERGAANETTPRAELGHPFRQKPRNNLIFRHLPLGFGGYAQSDGQTFVPDSADCGGIGMDVETISFAFLMIAVGAFVIWQECDAKTGMFSWLTGI
jgi:hypothetical protein